MGLGWVAGGIEEIWRHAVLSSGVQVKAVGCSEE